MKKRTEITVEIERTLIIKRAELAVYAWCPGCNRQVNMISPEAAAGLAGKSVREIFRQIEGGELHFLENTQGQLRICSDSLRQV